MTTTKLTGKARERAFKTWLRTLPVKYLLCRAQRLHSFPEEGYSVRIEGRHFVQTEVCAVCSTVREQKIIKTSGFLDGARYVRDSDTYNVPTGIGRLTKDEYGAFRLERIERFLKAQKAKVK